MCTVIINRYIVRNRYISILVYIRNIYTLTYISLWININTFKYENMNIYFNPNFFWNKKCLNRLWKTHRLYLCITRTEYNPSFGKIIINILVIKSKYNYGENYYTLQSEVITQTSASYWNQYNWFWKHYVHKRIRHSLSSIILVVSVRSGEEDSSFIAFGGG